MRELYLSISKRIVFLKHLKFKKLRHGRKPIIWLLLSLICIIGLYFLSSLIYTKIYNQQILEALSETRSISSKQAIKDTNLSQINQLFELPPDKSLTTGKITDIKSLKTKSPIFQNARNGDIILIYPDLTVIYDPVNKYIVSIVSNSVLK